MANILKYPYSIDIKVFQPKIQICIRQLSEKFIKRSLGLSLAFGSWGLMQGSRAADIRRNIM